MRIVRSLSLLTVAVGLTCAGYALGSATAQNDLLSDGESQFVLRAGALSALDGEKQFILGGDTPYVLSGDDNEVADGEEQYVLDGEKQFILSEGEKQFIL